MSTTTTTTLATPNSSANLWSKGLLAAAVATVINLLFFAIGSFAGGLAVQDFANPALSMPIVWYMVIAMTVIPILLGTGVFWLLRRFLPKQATLIFAVGAIALAVLSAIGPIMGGETVAAQVLLSLMHLTAGVTLVWFVTR